MKRSFGSANPKSQLRNRVTFPMHVAGIARSMITAMVQIHRRYPGPDLAGTGITPGRFARVISQRPNPYPSR